MSLTPPANYQARAEWLGDRLNSRDLDIIKSVHLLHLMTGRQIEELHFFDMPSSFTARKRVLRRLVKMRALVLIPRRMGGGKGGSGASMFACDPASIALIHTMRGVPFTRKPRGGSRVPVRLHSHTLAISEFYVRLFSTSRRSGAFLVSAFQTEPGCWWPNTSAPLLKPDAYFVLSNGRGTDHWWAEIDLGTENIPTAHDKFEAYTQFASEGFPGPGGVIPRVLVTTLNSVRNAALKRAIETLPHPANRMFRVTEFDTAPTEVAGELITRPPTEGQ